ncbi:MAG: hypothetical protein A3C02_00305 [Candidatus Andersenbacteria bacterium RIFCSPHIGHO2_02_FULL_45_11]|uniref:Uncharacterized protein n=1 Tax=Candidatus Andersenbacteria bacterium RIFCSPHIGHO2_12_FULL_45_11 TaxID=1797281 RepID=A0A1G1X1T3_9BACT|nr:MAG: hypothetical protein A2805_02215 [Candidatus Andersenbacteria bacterium RIFCSPHIGHO2_01_FULL_46_36]OGY33972.1 MAG: hypothetical protein A3D99_04105 [Candidatus Andersenbacteria bacterium RIFCSPHIGHO2_12_FULL_45_11]OGY34539.1 MAG: hypothetical protein A3C02_00305 [Candidatus Andersenbacteria bacterium RIFCSPHIGHO2_02_FULL_45_11]
MANKSAKISLIIGLALPALMVAIIAGLVFLPSKTLHPTTDFIYVVGPYPSYVTRTGDTTTQHDTTITSGKLTHTTTSYAERDGYTPYPFEKNSAPRFFIHHTQTDTNDEIPVEEISKLTLSPEKKSPDGFTLAFGKQSYGVFPFFFNGDTNREHAYLSTERASKEITLVSDTSVNYYEMQLVGWVVPTK